MAHLPGHNGIAVSEYRTDTGELRPAYADVMAALDSMGTDGMTRRWRQAKREAELDAFCFPLDPKDFRPVPTDWIPRLVERSEWDVIGAGVEQRLKALNLFLLHLYAGDQNVVPDDVVYSCQYFYPEYQGFRPAKDVFVHIYGIDLVQQSDGRYVVLEDNLRIPSGIAYQLKALEIGGRVFPEFGEGYDILPYDIKATYLDLFTSLCDNPSPTCALLTDSKFGSAFFEHRYLSELLDIPLVEGSDLYIGYEGDVRMKTIDGDVHVDLIYRRVEDLEIFVPGLTDAYLNGKVVLVNGMGTSVADDKLAFLWVPDMIREYLGEEPILEQAVSYDLDDAASRAYVLDNLDDMVLKTRQGYGGLGVYIMPDLAGNYRSQLSRQIIENPRAMIAQETIDFSRHVIFDEEAGEFDERYIDLRVYAVQNGRGEATAFPGGLTRVSRAGNRVTNNSSGGLCKPTWVIR